MIACTWLALMAGLLFAQEGEYKVKVTTVPKRRLIELILDVIPQVQVRTALNIRSNTNLENRLQSFTKTELLTILTSTEHGEEILLQEESRFPLHTSPTLYLVTLQRCPSVEEIIQKTEELAE